MPLKRRVMPDGSDTTPDVAGIAGLMGPLSIPGALAGIMGKAAELTPELRMELHELLGKPIQLGKRILMLSSADPAKNTAILHDLSSGSRVASPIDDFLKTVREAGMPVAEFPGEASALKVPMSQPGVRIAEAAVPGPKGGMAPVSRAPRDIASATTPGKLMRRRLPTADKVSQEDIQDVMSGMYHTPLKKP